MLYIVVILHVVSVVSAYGPNCLSCDAVALPEQCRHVVRCKDGQQCYTQRMLHDNKGVFYKLGCMTAQACTFYSTHAHDADVGKRAGTNFLQCSQCCQDPFCNHNMCTSTISLIDFHNCMECDKMNDPANECHTVRECARGEQCYVKMAKTGNSDFVYDMGCRTPAECSNETHKPIDGCFKCLNSSYSNMHACDNYRKTVVISG